MLTALSWTARRSPDDLYPPASIRMGEEGVATVRVCVGPNAKVVGTPEVTSSTGYPRLDQAAIAWTRDALVYKAATEDGRPVEACKGFKVTFDLK
ncbi:energy transducer TonB [bacterium]|nr:MAG: energy transducer TonB [bacterium]